MPATLYLDTEFDGFGGDLISLALYNPNGESFYEVKRGIIMNPSHSMASGIAKKLDPWVVEHVIPVLGKAPIGWRAFEETLKAYLLRHSGVRIVADWPEDFIHLFRYLYGEKGWQLEFECTAELVMSGPLHSAIPHNALEDAKALADWHVGAVAAVKAA